jgi:protein gp37
MMAALTKIEWADSTANLWIGCSKLSPGCDNCYAERDWDLRKHRVTWGPHGNRSFCAAGWDLILRMQRRAANNNGVDPDLGRPRRIFVNSLSDFFDNHRSIVWREHAFRLFESCRDVILILLTKRPENVIRMVPEHWLVPGGWPAHVWLLTSTEDQERYDHRWPILRDIPGPTVKGISCEPLLGPIALRDLLHLDWVIVGGESGPGARPMHPDWACHLQEQCASVGVPFLFKQWGEWIGGSYNGPTLDGDHVTFPDWGRVPAHDWGQSQFSARIGKTRAGRHLAGRTWDEVPA